MSENSANGTGEQRGADRRGVAGQALARALRGRCVRRGPSRPGRVSYSTSREAGCSPVPGCGAALFPSDTKFESGSGWPSFYRALDDGVDQRAQSTGASA